MLICAIRQRILALLLIYQCIINQCWSIEIVLKSNVAVTILTMYTTIYQIQKCAQTQQWLLSFVFSNGHIVYRLLTYFIHLFVSFIHNFLLFNLYFFNGRAE